jgi:multidrug efflux system membrane fusion protein
VTVAVARQQNVPIQLTEVGHVVPYQTVSVRSQVDGQLQSINFKEGDEVKQGQLIFVIDPGPYEAALNQAKGALSRDEALADNAAVEERRNAELLKNKIISQDTYDQSVATAKSARATVAADQAVVKNAELQLSYCFIRAPVDGRTGTLLLNVGNIVQKQTTQLIIINQIRPIFVDFSLPEKHLPSVRDHMAASGALRVQAQVPGHEQHQPAGRLTTINNTVDPTTGTILLRAEFPNTDEPLWPGQYVNTTLTLTVQTNAVVVPAEAVQNAQEGQYIFVVKADQTVEARPVLPGERVAGERVIERGIQPGERVVTSGQVRLAPGMKVQIQNQNQLAENK